MHKYQPRIQVLYWDGTLPLQINPIELMQLGCRKEFIFPETQFIAVTAYQNSQVSYSIDKYLFEVRKIMYHSSERCSSVIFLTLNRYLSSVAI